LAYIAPIEFIATLEDNLDMAAKAILAGGETIIAACGWKLHSTEDCMIVRSGDPAFELDRLASEINAGLIVVAAQGKTAMQHFLLGSVSESLALQSSLPVLVSK
jgi:nucleotide-binding universal stress UspA family protein